MCILKVMEHVYCNSKEPQQYIINGKELGIFLCVPCAS